MQESQEGNGGGRNVIILELRYPLIALGLGSSRGEGWNFASELAGVIVKEFEGFLSLKPMEIFHMPLIIIRLP